MEKRDLYDVNRNLIGETILSTDSIPDGRYISVVLCFIQNSENKFLVQKRSANKNGKYGFTSGHVQSGESAINGMVRELKEELGLQVNSKDLRIILTGRDDEARFIYDIYYINKDILLSDIELQKEEVEFVEWDSIYDIEDLIKKDLFYKIHSKIFFKVHDILENIN